MYVYYYIIKGRHLLRHILNSATPGIVIELSNILERAFKSEEMMQFVEKDTCWVGHYFFRDSLTDLF